MKKQNLSEKDRILIPEKEGESFYWRKEKDIKTTNKRVLERLKKEILKWDWQATKEIEIINKVFKEEYGKDLILKLKTLKDLPLFFPRKEGRSVGKSVPTLISSIQLKAEAIKWVKELNINGEHTFKKFFNLTEEDLK